MQLAREGDGKIPRRCVTRTARMREELSRMLTRLVIAIVAALLLAPSALAKGGNYVFDGGTRFEQAQVKGALDASSFDFSIVAGPVLVHIGRGAATEATPGNVYLDANLLDSGRFAWGVVQHEYAHQVDFSVLTDPDRARLEAALGGTAWCSGAAHAQLTCERFADLVAWAYWQTPDNCLRPASASDEGGQLSPAAFRALLADLLPQQPVRALSSSTGKPPRKG
jgi:hypothetical protein